MSRSLESLGFRLDFKPEFVVGLGFGRNIRNFRVVVSPDVANDRESNWPDGRYLRQGVRANGWVLLRQVPLGYEIWRQLNGFPPVVADDEPKSNNKASKVKLPKA